ncbi:MAG: hypothetical protein AB8H47_23510 [Bacteroidia bacterium]
MIILIKDGFSKGKLGVALALNFQQELSDDREIVRIMTIMIDDKLCFSSLRTLRSFISMESQ